MGLYSRLKDHTKLARKRTIHRTRIFFNTLTDRRPKRPVFVLATHRSGSNLLLSCLESTAQINVRNEILHPRMWYGIRLGASKKTALRHIAHSIHEGPHPISAVKMMLTRLSVHGLTVGGLRAAFPDARFIVVYRRSLLDQFVSLKIAQETGLWQWAGEGPERHAVVRIDRDEFRAFCTRTRALYRGIRGDLPADYALVAYEDLARDPQAVFKNTILPFLGLQPCAVSSPLRRQNRNKVEYVVSNYEELLSVSTDMFQNDFGCAQTVPA